MHILTQDHTEQARMLRTKCKVGYILLRMQQVARVILIALLKSSQRLK